MTPVCAPLWAHTNKSQNNLPYTLCRTWYLMPLSRPQYRDSNESQNNLTHTLCRIWHLYDSMCSSLGPHIVTLTNPRISWPLPCATWPLPCAAHDTCMCPSLGPNCSDTNKSQNNLTLTLWRTWHLYIPLSGPLYSQNNLTPTLCRTWHLYLPLSGPLYSENNLTLTLWSTWHLYVPLPLCGSPSWTMLAIRSYVVCLCFTLASGASNSPKSIFLKEIHKTIITRISSSIITNINVFIEIIEDVATWSNKFKLTW